MLERIYMALGRHILDNRHNLLEKRVFEVSKQLENQTLEGDHLGSRVNHALESDISIVVVHRADGIDHQMDFVILVKQVHAGLLHTDVGFGTVEYY